MDILQLSSAKREIINLTYSDRNSNVSFTTNTLLNIRQSTDEQDVMTFFIRQYGQGVNNSQEIRCTATQQTSNYLSRLLESKDYNLFYCLFLIIEVNDNNVVVQTFTFQELKEYPDPIHIIVPNEMLGIGSDFDPDNTKEQINIKAQLERFRKDYTWDGIGKPAIFYLNNNKKSDRKVDLSLLGDEKFLKCQNTRMGILVEKEINQLKYIPRVDMAIAPNIEFITQADASIINDDLNKNISRVSSSTSYMDRWDAYNELTKIALQEDKEEFGSLKYTNCEVSYDFSGVQYTFILNNNEQYKLDSSYLRESLCINPNDVEKNSRKMIPVGSIQNIKNDKVITFLETDDSDEIIPKQGYLELNTIGDEAVMKRREKARDRIRDESRVPMPNLLDLIESDSPQEDFFKQWGTNRAITDELKKNFKKAKNLTENQKKAIEIAINTPDICCIQGPPGTGKTTTIQAIVERFREIFEKEERDKKRRQENYIPRSPKILISSFQNEAVDNAIATTLTEDLPAFRKKAKTSKDTSESYQDTCEKWAKEYSSKLEKTIDNNVISRFLRTKQELNDQFLSYMSSERPDDKAKELIQKYLSYDVDINYPKSLVEKAKKIITKLSTKESENDTDPVLESFLSKIESLRTDKESFEDDGLRNVKRFLNFIQLDDEILSKISSDILKGIESACKESFSPAEDNKEFQEYRKAVETLKKSIVKEQPEKDYSIDSCIKDLAEYFETSYIDTLSLGDKASIFLGEFLLNLQNDHLDFIKKYATRTGATCQASLDLRGEDREYDLVIIDEAARANPMDLLIPMSQARKIILVGDQKQLPHMLEYDIIQQLAEDPKFKDVISEIEKTLFERLFDKLKKGSRSKSILLAEQFRMHPDICKFVSNCFYDGQLTTAKTMDLKKCSSPKEINNGMPLTFVNLPRELGEETQGSSKSRMIEVDRIIKDIRKILNHDPKATIGVITFYSAQENEIKKALAEELFDISEEKQSNIKIGTVDAFQGKEFNYVLLSCVRSNIKRNVGFLEKPNRLCVAFSRAQKQLIVYGDAETLRKIPCFDELYTICQNN